MTERELFEAWYGLEYGDDLQRDALGDYAHGGLVLQWEAWQARAALASATPSEPIVGTAADGKTEVFSIPGYPLMVRAVDFNAALTAPQAKSTHPSDEQRQRVRANAIGAPEAPAVSEAHRQRWEMLFREILSESETLDGVTRLSPGHFKALVAVYKKIATTPPAPEVEK